MTSWNDPIPSDGRLVRAVRRAAEHARHAKLIARIAKETGRTLEHPTHDRFEFPNPVDLRGIPALGRGVGGVIKGTRPDAIADQDDDTT